MFIFIQKIFMFIFPSMIKIFSATDVKFLIDNIDNLINS
jgi:hypothetical protein